MGRMTATIGPIGSPSPDVEMVSRASRSIVLRVVVVCAVLMFGGATVVFGYLWWRAIHPDTPERGSITVEFEPLDLIAAGALGVIFAVACTGLAAWDVSRRAVQPLADSLRRQRAFVADASHELKTPVAVVDSRAQQLQAMVGHDSVLLPHVRKLREDTALLTGIIEELLSLAMIESAPEGTTMVSAPMAAVCERLEKKYPHIPVRTDVPEVKVAVPASAMERILTAVLDNALSFAPEGTHVEIYGHEDSETLDLYIKDQGPGIAGEDSERIFDRFARMNRHGEQVAVNRASHGIGLAIARETARRYGGDVSVAETGPQGTVMCLSLRLEVIR